MTKKTKPVLIIAGFDPTGHAGILKDIAVLSKIGVRGEAVVTALTAQNDAKFLRVDVVDGKMFRSQLKALLPLSRFGAIKIGMLGNDKIVSILAGFLKKYPHPPVILDTVLRSSTGGCLLTAKGLWALKKKLLPLVELVTPNLPEMQTLFGNESPSLPFYLKGGHGKGKKVTDVYADGNSRSEFVFPRLKGPFRGTGCALASLIAGYVALGCRLDEAVKRARMQMQQLLSCS